MKQLFQYVGSGRFYYWPDDSPDEREVKPNQYFWRTPDDPFLREGEFRRISGPPACPVEMSQEQITERIKAILDWHFGKAKELPWRHKQRWLKVRVSRLIKAAVRYGYSGKTQVPDVADELATLKFFNRVAEWAQVNRDTNAKSPLPTPRRKGKTATVGQRMAAMLAEDPNRLSWSASQWATKLGCTAAAVKQTKAWTQTIKSARAIFQADRKAR